MHLKQINHGMSVVQTNLLTRVSEHVSPTSTTFRMNMALSKHMGHIYLSRKLLARRSVQPPDSEARAFGKNAYGHILLTKEPRRSGKTTGHVQFVHVHTHTHTHAYTSCLGNAHHLFCKPNTGHNYCRQLHVTCHLSVR